MNRIIKISKILKNPIKLYSQNNSRFFSEIINSSSSHEDFRPKKKVNDSDIEEINKFIKKLITDNKIMLFMKGTPSMPQCGFSYKVSEILKDIGIYYYIISLTYYFIISLILYLSTQNYLYISKYL